MSDLPTIKEILHSADGITNRAAITQEEEISILRSEIATLKMERDALREALAQNICVCEYPYHGAQPVGVSRCERCNKHYSAELRGLLSIPASGEPARKP